MEKNKLSNVGQELKLNLLDYHLCLNTGNDIYNFYQAAKGHQIGLQQIQNFLGQNGARLIAAPIPLYENTSLAERLDDVLLNTLTAFIKESQFKGRLIHLHCPAPQSLQAVMINKNYLQLIFDEYFPNYQLVITNGSYLSGLAEAAIAANDQPEWISAAIDCQTDDKTLKALSLRGQCMTSSNDQAAAPGEAYVFFKFSQSAKGLGAMTLIDAETNLEDSCKKLRAYFSRHNTRLQHLIYPNLRKIEGIEHFLALQRQLWPADKPAAGLSPYLLCGDTGAASEALCLLLAYADAKDKLSFQQGLLINSQTIAVHVQITEDNQHD